MRPLCVTCVTSTFLPTPNGDTTCGSTKRGATSAFSHTLWRRFPQSIRPIPIQASAGRLRHGRIFSGICGCVILPHALSVAVRLPIVKRCVAISTRTRHMSRFFAHGMAVTRHFSARRHSVCTYLECITASALLCARCVGSRLVTSISFSLSLIHISEPTLSHGHGKTRARFRFSCPTCDVS